MALNNLAGFLSSNQRLKEAEAAYIESLAIFRQLAKENPAAYLSYVVGTQSNLGIIYIRTQRLGEAEVAYEESLAIYRQLTMKNEAAYLPEVALTHNDLGHVYSGTGRLGEAVIAYREALKERTRDRVPLHWAQPKTTWGPLKGRTEFFLMKARLVPSIRRLDA